MTQELTAADGRFSLCLNDIDGFESMIARMPAPEECQDAGLSADVPLLVMRRRGGHEQLYRADLVTLTIDQEPPPAAWDVRDAARYVLGCILEDLSNVLSDVAMLHAAMSGPPRGMVKLADEFRQRRAREISAVLPEQPADLLRLLTQIGLVPPRQGTTGQRSRTPARRPRELPGSWRCGAAVAVWGWTCQVACLPDRQMPSLLAGGTGRPSFFAFCCSAVTTLPLIVPRNARSMPPPVVSACSLSS